MPYRLKLNMEAFQVVDGQFAGRRYEHGKAYADADVPPQEKQKFESVQVTSVSKTTQTLKTDTDTEKGGKKK